MFVPLNKSIAITTGSDDIHKSSIAVNLALTLTHPHTHSCLLDMDTAHADTPVFLGHIPSHDLSAFMRKTHDLESLISYSPEGLGIIACRKNHTKLSQAYEDIICATQKLAPLIDYLIVNAPAGWQKNTIRTLAAADLPIIILGDKEDDFVNAYTLIKALHQQAHVKSLSIILNMNEQTVSAYDTFRNFRDTVHKFLNIQLIYLGHIPRDNTVRQVILRRRSIILGDQQDELAKSFQIIAKNLRLSPVNKCVGLRFMETIKQRSTHKRDAS